MAQRTPSARPLPYAICCLAALVARTATPTARAAAADRPPTKARILFLHHSTGECIWNGGVRPWFDAYNQANGTRYTITEQAFPKSEPYGWENYPYDYWNIWVRHAGPKPYKTEPTLEILAPKHDIIVFKHCFPVSAIEPDTGNPDIASPDKRIENYKLQYAALKTKLHRFPKTKFLVWTGAALVPAETDQAAARRAKAFFDWVRTAWDTRGDNIYIWDFHTLQTDGGLTFKPAYASGDSHPNGTFSRRVAPMLCRRIVDVIRGAGDATSLTGQGGKPPVAARPAGSATVDPSARDAEPSRPTAPNPPAPLPLKPGAPDPMPKPGPDAWVFDNAEKPKLRAELWPAAAAYAKDADAHVIKIRFAQGKEEDWGEYGLQRIVTTRPPRQNHDIAPYRFVALRVRTDRDMEMVFTLVTRPDGLPPSDESYFAFSAYLHPKVGRWHTVALDLTKLELGQEGDRVYNAASKPRRPMTLTALKLVTHKKNENADVSLDDIVFYRTLPKALAGCLQQP